MIPEAEGFVCAKQFPCAKHHAWCLTHSRNTTCVTCLPQQLACESAQRNTCTWSNLVRMWYYDTDETYRGLAIYQGQIDLNSSVDNESKSLSKDSKTSITSSMYPLEQTDYLSTFIQNIMVCTSKTPVLV